MMQIPAEITLFHIYIHEHYPYILKWLELRNIENRESHMELHINSYVNSRKTTENSWLQGNRLNTKDAHPFINYKALHHQSALGDFFFLRLLAGCLSCFSFGQPFLKILQFLLQSINPTTERQWKAWSPCLGLTRSSIPNSTLTNTWRNS